MNSELEKQEVAVENCRKEMATFSESMKEIKDKVQWGLQEVESYIKGSVEKSTKELNNQLIQLSSQMPHDIEKETKNLNEEFDQLNMKTIEMEKNSIWVSKFLPADVRTIKKPKNQLNAIEAFQRGEAIEEQLVNKKLSVQQLVDTFLFGSTEEQMVFESLCFKWTIKHLKQLIPEEGSHEQLSGIFSVYGFQLKAQLKLTISSYGHIYLELCFKDEAREGQEVDIKPLPMVTYIIKVLRLRNKHCIRYEYHPFNKSLRYNQFGYGIRLSKSKWNAIFFPRDASLEVLVLVEPPVIIHKLISTDGTITDTIEHYSRKLLMAKEGLIDFNWSPFFLTQAGGYRVAVGMWMNWPLANNKRGLKAWIGFLSGEFDFQLSEEFDHETSVTLINQLDVEKNITVKEQAKEANSYWLEIASWDVVGSGGFLVNDSLTYQVKIKPI